jgi:hypothetical protein
MPACMNAKGPAAANPVHRDLQIWSTDRPDERAARVTSALGIDPDTATAALLTEMLGQYRELDRLAPEPWLPQSLLDALDRFIAEQDEPCPSRAAALCLILEDWLTSRGHLPLAWKTPDSES